jgi:hypothetical protein
MAFIFKILSLLASLVTTAFLVVEGVRGGLLIVSTILGLVKILIMLAFCALLVYIFYLLLLSKNPPSPDNS